MDLNGWEKGGALQTPKIGHKKDVRFYNGHKCICIALEHPSMRKLNVHRRVYENPDGITFKGHEAEVEMLKSIM